MRNAFAEEIAKAAVLDERVVLLSGDIGNKLFDPFKAVAPGRLYNCGVAEANMTGVAAGLAMMGYRPFTYSITPFVTMRCLEQIRVDLCYHNLPAVVVGTGAGLSYAELGPTHHSVDDIGVLRVMPNISILAPCDALEAKSAIWAALKHNGPVYIRLGKKGEPRIHKEQPNLVIGKSITIRDGSDICILSAGNMMSVALEVADGLEAKNISTRVESFHTIKPLDEELLKSLFENYATVVTLEEHSMINGLGSAVAEWMVDRHHTKTRLYRFGTRDEFLPFIGTQAYGRDYFGLTTEKILNHLLREIN